MQITRLNILTLFIMVMKMTLILLLLHVSLPYLFLLEATKESITNESCQINANLECLFLTFCLTYYSSWIAVRNLSEKSYDFSKELNENKFNLLEQNVLLLQYFIKWRRKK